MDFKKPGDKHKNLVINDIVKRKILEMAQTLKEEGKKTSESQARDPGNSKKYP